VDPDGHGDVEETPDCLVQYITEKTFFHLGLNITNVTLVDKFLYVTRTSSDNKQNKPIIKYFAPLLRKLDIDFSEIVDCDAEKNGTHYQGGSGVSALYMPAYFRDFTNRPYMISIYNTVRCKNT
jgi:hypothetical protein